MLLGNLRNDAVADKGRFIKQELLYAYRQVGIKQTTEADNHDRGMRKDVAPLIARALLGSDQRGIFFFDDFGFITVRRYPCQRLRCQGST